MNWEKMANFIQALTNLVLFYAAIVILGLVLLAAHGCMRVDGETTHTVQGEATVRVVVGVDITPCEQLPPADKLECINALVELAKEFGDKADTEQTFPGAF